MNQTELKKYKAILEAKAAELSAGLRNRDDIAIEKTPDAQTSRHHSRRGADICGDSPVGLVALSCYEVVPIR